MSVNNKDTTSADYLDAQRQAIAKERAATIAQKAFTPSYTYVLTEQNNITDAVDTDATPAFADTGNITDDISGTVVQPSRQFTVASLSDGSDQTQSIIVEFWTVG